MSGEQTAFPVNKLVVIGLGLIGGSLAAALKQRQLCSEIIGVARRQETLDIALENHIVDRGVLSIEAVAHELGSGDVIFIAVPTLAVKATLEIIHSCVSPEVTITDGASVKGSVVNAAKEVYGQCPAQLVPGHPIAGSEKSGVMAAKADLYADHRVILTPLDTTEAEHIQRAQAMWQAVDAEVLCMSVDEHDTILGATSHLPHVIAYSLVDTLANDAEDENIFRYAAGGFRDFTRIASSDPQMWHDIMRANPQAILKSIDLFQANLSQLRHAIETDDSEYLLQTFTRAKAARDHFTAVMCPQSANASKS